MRPRKVRLPKRSSNFSSVQLFAPDFDAIDAVGMTRRRLTVQLTNRQQTTDKKKETLKVEKVNSQWLSSEDTKAPFRNFREVRQLPARLEPSLMAPKSPDIEQYSNKSNCRERSARLMNQLFETQSSGEDSDLEVSKVEMAPEIIADLAISRSGGAYEEIKPLHSIKKLCFDLSSPSLSRKSSCQSPARIPTNSTNVTTDQPFSIDLGIVECPLTPEEEAEEQAQDWAQQSILDYDYKAINTTKDFHQKILACEDSQQHNELIIQRIKPHSNVTFEMRVIDSLMDREYQLWIGTESEEPILLLKANKSIKIHKTVFEILKVWKKGGQSCVHSFLQSTFDRKTFNLFPKSQTKEIPLTATLVQQPSSVHSKNLVLYQAVSDFQVQQLDETKFEYIKTNPTHFRRVSTTKLGVKERFQLMKERGWKVSDKSMEFSNENDRVKILIGKKESKTYNIVSGGGMSPIQLLALGIVNVQTR